jgi:hypothetical protein
MRGSAPDDFRPYAMDRDDLLTMEQALDRMRPIVGDSPGTGPT